MIISGVGWGVFVILDSLNTDAVGVFSSAISFSDLSLKGGSRDSPSGINV